MRLINLKRVSDHDVRKWIEDNVVEMTPYQKQRLHYDEVVRFAPFYFMEERKKVKNVFVRFSVIFIIPIFILILIGLPINFFITGEWGYSDGKMKWFSKWVSACGLH